MAPRPAAAVLNNGENAEDILGQFASVSSDTTPDYVKGCVNNGASQIGFNGPTYAAIDLTNNWLFLSDTTNSRVLVFPLNATTKQLSSKTASYVLGQTNFTSCAINQGNGNTPSQSSMYWPSGLAIDTANQRLFVADSNAQAGNARVLVFSYSGGFSNGMNASYELGAPNFTTFGNGILSQSGMGLPIGLAFDPANELLYVADKDYCRVTVFNVASGSIANGENASYVIGQSNYTTSCAYSATQSTLYYPDGLALDTANQWLYVADSSNNRVMVFPAYGNASWAGNGENASYVLGQSSFTTGTSGGVTASALGSPFGVTFDSVNNRLFVEDSGNARVMVFNTSSLSNGMNASYVLGQPSFTTWNNPTNASQTDIWGNYGAAYDSTNNLLYVEDSGHSRVMIFSVPTSLPTISSPSQSGPDACALATGALWCWGFNTYGEDAIGNTVGYNTPQPAETMVSSWSLVNMGYPSACGIAGGALYCWGGNVYGEAGQGNTTEYTTPQQVGTDTSWTVVSTSNSDGGPADTCGIDNGKLYCWGENLYGEVGNGDGPNFNTVFVASTSGSPTTGDIGGGSGGVTAANSICQNASTASGSIAPAGTYLAWIATIKNGSTGANDPYTTFTHSTIPYKDVNGNLIATNWNSLISGTLINGITLDQTGTAQSGSVWTNVSATTGQASTNGSSANRNCTAWTVGTTSGTTNEGRYGTLGATGTTWSQASGELVCGTSAYLLCFSQSSASNEVNSPVQIGTDTTWTAVSTEGTDTCGIDNGKLYCWGENKLGEDGLGNTTNYVTPQQVGSATNWIYVTQGGGHACGIQGSGGQGALYCWGSNVAGQLGQGNTTSSSTPVQVGSATNWTAVSAWGYVAGGDFGDTCGIQGGALYCWGECANGECGLGTTTEQNSPVQVGSATNWTAISMGDGNACGIQGGALYCWGGNNGGQDGLGNETQYTTPQLVAFGLNGENATDELGQYTTPVGFTDLWTASGPNNGPTALGLNNGNAYQQSSGLALDRVNHQLFVSDNANCRVLVYTLNNDNSIPTASGGHTASYVIGQTSLQGSSGCGSGAAQISTTGGMAVDTVNNRLFVVGGNADVLVYNTPITSNGPAAIAEVGAPYLGYSGSYGCTQSLTEGPEDIAYDSVNQNLYVSDPTCQRVLVFNVPPGFTSGENASYEIGQPAGASQFTSNSGGGGQSGLYLPNGLAYDPVNSRLFVTDSGNERVMVFSTATLSDGPNAIAVIGQTSFTGNSYGCGATQVYGPSGLAYDPNSGRLFVNNGNCDNVLVYNASPQVLPEFNASAAHVLGAPGFSSNTGTTTQSGLNLGTWYDELNPIMYDPGSGRLFVGDTQNNRILIFGADNTTPNFFPLMPD